MAVFFEYAENVELGVAAVATSTEMYYSIPLSNPSSVVVAQHTFSPGHTGTSEYLFSYAIVGCRNSGATGATIGISLQFKDATSADWTTLATNSGAFTSTESDYQLGAMGHSTVAKVVPVMTRILVTATAAGSCTFVMGSGTTYHLCVAGWIGS